MVGGMEIDRPMSRKTKRGEHIKRTGIAIDGSVLDDIQLIANKSYRTRNNLIELILREHAAAYWAKQQQPGEKDRQ